MTITAHALVGGAIAASIQNPTLGILISAATHPILDMIPHWDEGWGWRQKTKLRLFTESFLDLVLGVVLTYFLFGQNIPLWYLMACIFASLFWDFLEAPYLFLNWKFPPFYQIYKIQSRLQGKLKAPWGILTQVASVGVVVLALSVITGQTF